MILPGEAHFRRILKTYAAHYNKVRTHLSLGKDAPKLQGADSVGSVVATLILGGLHHQHVRVEFLTMDRYWRLDASGLKRIEN